MTPAGRPNNPVRTNFEANLLTLMAESDIPDYASLARKAHTTTATIQRICSGVVQPSLPTLKKLATALNCKVDDLLTTEI